MYNNELYHFGVKGMKWGVRKEDVQRVAGYTRLARRLTKHTKRRYNRKISRAARINGESGIKAVISNKRARRSKRYTKADRDFDEYMYGKKGQQRIEQRTKNGCSKRIARGKEQVRKSTINTAIDLTLLDIQTGGAVHRTAGKVFNATAGKAFSKAWEQRNARKSIIKIPQNKFFDPIDVKYKIVD